MHLEARNSRDNSMKYLVLFLALVPGCPLNDLVDNDNQSQEETALRVEEADATIKLYNSRLRSVEAQLKQDIINRNHNYQLAIRLHALLLSNAVTMKDYLTILKDYDLSVLEVIQTAGEVEEAIQDVELAKVRRKIASLGEKSNAIKIDRIRVKGKNAK